MDIQKYSKFLFPVLGLVLVVLAALVFAQQKPTQPDTTGAIVIPGGGVATTTRTIVEEPIVKDITPSQTPQPDNEKKVTDFFSCVDVTGIILESYPRQCIYNDVTYIEEIEPVLPTDGDAIELIVSIGPNKVPCTGVAPQTCLVVDGQNFYDEIRGFVHNEGYKYIVKIKRTLAFGTTDPALIPADAGLYAYELVEVLEEKQTVELGKRCVISGCSSQLCISEEQAAQGGGISTCEYREEYACYAVAECAVQETGECGWTQTPELEQCISNPPNLQ